MLFRIVVLLNIVSVRVFAQSADPVVIQKGIEKFVLGASISQFQGDLGYMPGGKFTWNDSTTYTYQYCPLESSPFFINGIPFRSVMLTFYNNQSLLGFEFFAVYADKPTPALQRNSNGNHRKASKDYQALVNYMNTKWGTAGKQTVYNKLSYFSAYEWTSTNSIMQLTLQYSSRDPRKFTTIGVSLRSIPPRK